MTLRVVVQTEDFDVAAETARLTAGRRDIGALVSFTGLCRDEGGRLAALDLEHYPGMAEAEIARVAQEALARWSLQAVTIIHRAGRIEVGKQIVLAMVASPHRAAAFAAAEFLMDYLKTRAPFWKKQIPLSGPERDWVDATGEDDRAAERWRG